MICFFMMGADLGAGFMTQRRTFLPRSNGGDVGLSRRSWDRKGRHAPSSMGSRGKRSLPWSWSSGETLAGIQTAQGWPLG